MRIASDLTEAADRRPLIGWLQVPLHSVTFLPTPFQLSLQRSSVCYNFMVIIVNEKKVMASDRAERWGLSELDNG
jgi:hypothetical protein